MTKKKRKKGGFIVVILLLLIMLLSGSLIMRFVKKSPASIKVVPKVIVLELSPSEIGF